MSTPSPTIRRITVRVTLALLGAAAAVAVPGVATAHVSVQPGEAEGGSYSVVAFRVPNERDDASTVKLRVLLPEEQPVASVATTPMPGWQVSTRTRKLAKPMDQDGRRVTKVVSEVTWTATGNGLRPGQFEDFEVNLGPLPDSGQMVFKALQTYDRGEEVHWNEVALGDAAEPEHPAPVLRLTEPPAPGAAVQASATGSSPSQVERSGDSDSTLPLVLSGLALVAALGALGVSLRRGRT